MPVQAPLWIVDAFADSAFRGNPAAVCLLAAAAPKRWMQAVANEMNLSETAFLAPEGNSWRLRWFTPAMEVDLCGHATLASAHVLYQQGLAAATDTIRFETRSGQLTARKQDARIELDFPAINLTEHTTPEEVTAALGIAPRAALQGEFYLLMDLESAAHVRSLTPDMARLKAATSRCVLVTAPSDDPRYDFVSRFFAPAAGVPEDPVTGSAHCILGPYWAPLLGKNRLVGWQASARGGEVEVVVCGDRCLLRGTAVTVLEGRLLSDPCGEWEGERQDVQD